MDFVVTIVEEPSRKCQHPHKNITQTLPPTSPVIYFLKLCCYIFYVPFAVKWNTTQNRFTFSECLFRKLWCGILHTFCLAYNVIVVIDHFNNIDEPSNSLLSEWFVFVLDCAAAFLWLLFIKLVWCDKQRLEVMVNKLTSNVFNRKHLFIITSIIAITAVIQIYVCYKYAYKVPKFAAKPILKIWGHISLWASKHWVLMIAQLYAMQCLFIQECLVFTLNCSLLGKAWELRNDLNFVGTQNLEKVCTIINVDMLRKLIYGL